MASINYNTHWVWVGFAAAAGGAAGASAGFSPPGP